jgi:hypothetical protein
MPYQTIFKGSQIMKVLFESKELQLYTNNIPYETVSINNCSSTPCIRRY